jgi:hypothetical protein
VASSAANETVEPCVIVRTVTPPVAVGAEAPAITGGDAMSFTVGVSTPPVTAGAGARRISTGHKSLKVTDNIIENLKGEFLKNLITNFDELVINFLDKSARDAIIQQKEFTDEKEFRRIKAAVESRVLDLLVNQSQLSTTPVVGFFRQVVGVLANRYPYMFLEDPTVTVQGIKIRQFVGKGTGGLTGISSLPKALQQKFARMLESKNGLFSEKKKKRDLPDENSEHQMPKKKRKVYGITSDKFYVQGTEEQETFLGEVEYVESVEEREAMFSERRKDVQHRLVTSKEMFSAVPGFFSSLSHAENHFQWLTGKNIAKNIQAELPRQFKLLKCVVLNMCSTKEFRLNLEIAKLKGSEQNGSITPEFVCLLRQLNVEWHKNAGGLLRFPGEPEDDSPHIFCPDGASSVKFDLQAERKKIYSDLNFSEVLRAFFCVAFIGNMHYPEAGEAVAILLQRKLAGINAEGKFYC